MCSAMKSAPWKLQPRTAQTTWSARSKAWRWPWKPPTRPSAWQRMNGGNACTHRPNSSCSRQNASSEMHATQELEQTKTKLATVERELRGALAKAQSATQRQAASTHSLKLERQNARLMRRNLAAGRLVALTHSASWSSAHRCFLKWSGFCALSPPAPPARPSAHDAHAHQRARDDAHAARQPIRQRSFRSPR